MLEAAWDRATALLDRRFVTTALIPVLLFAPLVTLAIAFGLGQMSPVLAAAQSMGLATVFAGVVGYGLSCWFLASFIQSQLRNLIQFFEGYRWPLLHALWAYGTKAHLQRHDVAREENGGVRQYYLYPLSPKKVMPTRLGNALRASERYAWDRYRADTIVLWPRLAPLLPPAFATKVDEFREALEFLLVVTCWCFLFGVATAGSLLILGGNPLAFAALAILSFLAAYVAYTSAIEAAVEYGEELRVGMDLFRFALLDQLHLPRPHDLEGERHQWEALYDFIFSNNVSTLVYADGAPSPAPASRVPPSTA